MSIDEMLLETATDRERVYDERRYEGGAAVGAAPGGRGYDARGYETLGGRRRAGEVTDGMFFFLFPPALLCFAFFSFWRRMHDG